MAPDSQKKEGKLEQTLEEEEEEELLPMPERCAPSLSTFPSHHSAGCRCLHLHCETHLCCRGDVICGYNSRRVAKWSTTGGPANSPVTSDEGDERKLRLRGRRELFFFKEIPINNPNRRV